jgi:Predicted transcriptional regulators
LTVSIFYAVIWLKMSPNTILTRPQPVVALLAPESIFTLRSTDDILILKNERSYLMELSKRMKEEREKRNWSQDKLADQLHVTRQAVSKWETGQSYPDIDKLIQIAELFMLSLDELVKGNQKLVKKLKKEGNKTMTGLSILGYVLIVMGILIIIWGGLLYPVNFMNSDFMSFLVGGLVLLTIGVVIIHVAPIWLTLTILWLLAASTVMFLIVFIKPITVALMGITVILGFALWLTLLLLKYKI